MRQDMLNLVNQMPSSEVKSYFFKNNGDLTFSNTSADWGINYMHAKFNILTPFNNRLFVPSYDGRILVMG